jgi:ABC-type multidrug transport system fused ATPase/permease subunit
MFAQQLSTFKQIQGLWRHLLPRRKKQLLIVSLLMIVASLAEVLSISAVIPFLGILTSPERIFAHELALPFIQALRIQTPHSLLLPFTLLFIVAAIFAGLVRIILLWCQTRVSLAIGADFSVQVYESSLYQPYSSHISGSSSEILAGIQKANGLVNCLLQPILTISSSLFILFAVMVSLIAFDPKIALAVFGGFGCIYLGIILLTKRRILKNSKVLDAKLGKVNKAIQEGMGGIRDILIDGTQSVYCKLFKDAFIPMRLASASNQIAAASPRFAIEALGLTLIAGLAYALASPGGAEGGAVDSFPILGALALAAQRLLPLLQQSYSAYIVIKGNQSSTQHALNLLDQPLPDYRTKVEQPSETLPFHRAIVINDLSFRYSAKEAWVLRNLNLEIPKGSRVGFVGVTGGGKSTLFDIVMGLLFPTEGVIVIDDIVVTSVNIRAWQKHISHVPQMIFLADTSIAENIAFGVPSDLIDMQRVRQAARQARIADDIEEWRSGYDTLVGERGIRLSGGQRQRIGIARALYKRASVIILDEATSALDRKTEAAVMETIENLDRNLTILIAAHRLETLKNCDLTVELAQGGIRFTSKF